MNWLNLQLGCIEFRILTFSSVRPYAEKATLFTAEAIGVLDRCEEMEALQNKL